MNIAIAYQRHGVDEEIRDDRLSREDALRDLPCYECISVLSFFLCLMTHEREVIHFLAAQC